MNDKEYGGYLPLELDIKSCYHNYDDTKIIKCNSGLTSIYCALKISVPKILYIPYFICESVKDLAKSMGIQTMFYFIDDSFMPLNINLLENEYILWVNYFGVCDDKIIGLINKFDRVIIDNTQSFFTEPVFKKNVYNVYSCRKFIGVPDGGYLISDEIKDVKLEQDYSSERSMFLFKQIEYGINAAYRDSLDNYNAIKNQRRSMSVLTRKLLKSVDYIKIKNKRKDNFLFLHSKLKKYNLFVFPNIEICNPYSYPLLLDTDIRKELISKKIYVPTLWVEYINNDYFGKVEYYYSKNICHLPIDQRYNETDMEYIVKCVIEIVGKK